MTPEQMYTVGNSLFISPHEWIIVDKYTIRHEPTDFELWVSNGPAFYYSFNPKEETVYLPMWWLRPHYRFLHRAVKYRQHRQIDQILRDML